MKGRKKNVFLRRMRKKRQGIKREREDKKQFHIVAAIVSEQWGEILPLGNLWFPTAKQMKCAGLNNQGCTHTFTWWVMGKSPGPAEKTHLGCSSLQQKV